MQVPPTVCTALKLAVSYPDGTYKSRGEEDDSSALKKWNTTLVGLGAALGRSAGCKGGHLPFWNSS